MYASFSYRPRFVWVDLSTRHATRHVSCLKLSDRYINNFVLTITLIYIIVRYFFWLCFCLKCFRFVYDTVRLFKYFQLNVIIAGWGMVITYDIADDACFFG